MIDWGSSPLTRGKRGHHAPLENRQRLIPAHAGKTRITVAGFRRLKAHPRSRGENTASRGGDYSRQGSSPLTRGKPGRALHSLRQLGLIPAHAGKTDNHGCIRIGGRAHPRSRGENRVLAVLGSTREGSSPLTRGKRHLEPAGRDRRGLIPAHAGKTTPIGCGISSPPAHPRSRGENCDAEDFREALNGSSPLTRGKR